MNRIVRLGDYIGMGASGACLLHCIATPLLLLLFPMLGWAQHDEQIHRYMTAFVVAPAILALIPGYLAHRRRMVAALGFVGVTCFFVAFAAEEVFHSELLELALFVAGGACLFMAHLNNRRFCRHCLDEREARQ